MTIEKEWIHPSIHLIQGTHFNFFFFYLTFHFEITSDLQQIAKIVQNSQLSSILTSSKPQQNEQNQEMNRSNTMD